MGGQSDILVDNTSELKIDWEELAKWDYEVPEDSPYKNFTADEILDLFDDEGNEIIKEDKFFECLSALFLRSSKSILP